MGIGQRPCDPLHFEDEYLLFLAYLDGAIHREQREDLKDKMIRYQTLFACGGYLGERAKEMLNTTWHDVVDKKEATLYQFKTSTKRELEFPASFIKMVNRNYELAKPTNLHHLILHKADNSLAPVSTDVFNQYFARQLKKSGIATTTPASHTLRKTHMLKMYHLLLEGDNDKHEAQMTLAKWMNYEKTSEVRHYIGLTRKAIKGALGKFK